MFAPPGANVLTYLAMLGFVPFAIGCFFMLRPQTAVLFVVLSGELFLPGIAWIDLPGLPAIDKYSLVYIGVLAGALARDSRRIVAGRFGTGLELLGILWVAGSLGTVLTNTDRLVYGSRVLEAMNLVDWLTGSIENLLRYALPAFLGRIYFTNARDLRELLQWLVVGGVVYSIIAIGEVRISPQFHFLTYGYLPGGFDLAVRYGGFRPMGYMQHGLALTIFLVTTQVAASALARARLPVLPFPWLPFAGVLRALMPIYLTGIITICKSIGSAIYSIFLLLVIRLLPPRLLSLIAIGLCVVGISYPLLRTSPFFDADAIIASIREIDAERAHSLNARFTNEEAMLARGRERIVFGWGGYGRNWVIDPETGEELTVPDGFWVIQLSAFGLVGFLSTMLLHAVPVIGAGRRLARIRGRTERILLTGLMLAVTIRMVDLIPNGFFSALPVFLAGALWGTARGLVAADARARKRAAEPSDVRGPAPEPRPRRADAPVPRRRWSDLGREPEPGTDGA